MTLRCIAIDDEPVALDILNLYCKRFGSVCLETFTSWSEGMERIARTLPDIVFMDIEMNGVSGLALAKELPPSCLLILTTAFSDYALEGFEVDAVDFLHKPFFYDRFEKAMHKAVRLMRMDEVMKASQSADRQLVLKSGYRNVNIPFDSIRFIESIDNYVKVHLADSGEVMSKITLQSVGEMLPEGLFIRIHRSYIVPRNRISSFSRSGITLSPDGTLLPVGRKYMDEVTRILQGGQP